MSSKKITKTKVNDKNEKSAIGKIVNKGGLSKLIGKAGSPQEEATSPGVKKVPQKKQQLKDVKRRNIEDLKSVASEINSYAPDYRGDNAKKTFAIDSRIRNEINSNQGTQQNFKKGGFTVKFPMDAKKAQTANHYQNNKGNSKRCVYDPSLGPRNRFNTNFDKSMDIYHTNHASDPQLRPTHKIDIEYKNKLEEQIDERKKRHKSYLPLKPDYDVMVRYQSADNLSKIINKNNIDTDNPLLSKRVQNLDKRRRYFWENLVNNSQSYAEIIDNKHQNTFEKEYPQTDRPTNKFDKKNTPAILNEIFRSKNKHDQPDKDIFHDQLDKLVANDSFRHKPHRDFLKKQMIPEDIDRVVMHRKMNRDDKYYADQKAYNTTEPKSNLQLGNVYSAAKDEYVNNRARNGLFPTIEIKPNGHLNENCRVEQLKKKHSRPAIFNIETANQENDNRVNSYNNHVFNKGDYPKFNTQKYEKSSQRNEVYVNNDLDIANIIQNRRSSNKYDNYAPTNNYNRIVVANNITPNHGCYHSQNYNILNHQNTAGRKVQPSIPWEVSNMYPKQYNTMEYKNHAAPLLKD